MGPARNQNFCNFQNGEVSNRKLSSAILRGKIKREDQAKRKKLMREYKAARYIYICCHFTDTTAPTLTRNGQKMVRGVKI